MDDYSYDTQCYCHFGGGDVMPIPIPRHIPVRPGAPLMAISGPVLWADLHRRALGFTGEQDSAWLGRFRERISCPTCRAHWEHMVAAYPPAFGGDSYFAWTVGRHNDVNRSTGKATMTVEEARKRWA